MPGRVAQPQRPAPDRGDHDQRERQHRQPGTPRAQRRVHHVEQRPVPVLRHEQQQRVSEGGGDREERDLPVVGQHDVDAKRRRAAGEPGRQGELQAEDGQRDETQRHRELDEKATAGARLHQAQAQRRQREGQVQDQPPHPPRAGRRRGPSGGGDAGADQAMTAGQPLKPVAAGVRFDEDRPRRRLVEDGGHRRVFAGSGTGAIDDLPTGVGREGSTSGRARSARAKGPARIG